MLARLLDEWAACKAWRLATSLSRLAVLTDSFASRTYGYGYGHPDGHPRGCRLARKPSRTCRGEQSVQSASGFAVALCGPGAASGNPHLAADALRAAARIAPPLAG